MMQIKEIFGTYWGVFTLVGSILLTGIGNIVDQRVKIDRFESHLNLIEQSLSDEHNLMKLYVDSKDHVLRIRINNLYHAVDKERQDFALDDQKLNGGFGQGVLEIEKEILQQEKETNHQLNHLITNYDIKNKY